MKLLFAHDHIFYRFNNVVYSTGGLSKKTLERYTAVFDKVQVVSRQMEIEEAKKYLKEWLKRNNFSAGREWSYKNIKPKIIAEELLEDQNNQFDGINDYKFLCFNGEAKYIILDVDRFVDHKRNIYDVEWNFINVSTDKPNLNNSVLKPDGLDEMLNIASTLAEDFPFVRVDLYWVNNRVYFGELTFYPWSGYVQFEPDEFDFVLGKQFKLPI